MELQARADRLAQLIEEKLDIRGKGFEAKLNRAGRLLPKHIRTEAAILVEAMAHEAHPKLARQLDDARLERAASDVERYLQGLDPWARRKGIALDWMAGAAFKFLVVVGLTLALLRWRGFF